MLEVYYGGKVYPIPKGVFQHTTVGHLKKILNNNFKDSQEINLILLPVVYPNVDVQSEEK